MDGERGQKQVPVRSVYVNVKGDKTMISGIQKALHVHMCVSMRECVCTSMEGTDIADQCSLRLQLISRIFPFPHIDKPMRMKVVE